jgi:SOS-response transcriptional repressor LexA
MHGAAAAIVTAAAGLPTPSVEGKVIRRTRLPRLATLQIHHPTRAQQTAGTPRSLSFTGTTGKKNPIKRRARLLPRRRSSFSYTEKPSPTRLRAKNRLHTRPKSFPLHRRLPTQQQLVERVVAGRPVYTQESQEKHFSLSSSISKNQR